MNACDELIVKLTRSLPEICTINDLIRAGIVKSRMTMEYYRRNKKGPAYLRLSSKKIYYPKTGVIKWLKDNSYDGEETSKANEKIQSIPRDPSLA